VPLGFYEVGLSVEAKAAVDLFADKAEGVAGRQVVRREQLVEKAFKP